MTGEWENVPLESLIEPGRGISYGIVQPGSPVSDGVPIVRVSDVRDGRIATSDPLRVSPAIEAAYSRTRLSGGELLLTIVGTVGETAVVPESLAGWNTARAVAVVPVRKEVGSYWVQMALRAPGVRAIINSRLNTTVQATLNLGDVVKLPIVLPPPRERAAIAHILGTLDDKIELNRLMNETLEAMARALFKSWFVDFDPVRAKVEGRDPLCAEAAAKAGGLPRSLAELFPAAFEDSELGEIPKGWGTHPLGDLMTLDKGLSYKGQFLTEHGVPMVNLGCFLGRGQFAEKAIKKYSGEYKPRHVVHPRDLVLANTDITQQRDVIGSPALVPPQGGLSELIFSHHVFAARFHEGREFWKMFVYFLLLQDDFRARAAGFATGTTVLALPRDAVLDVRFPCAPRALVTIFSEIALTILEREWRSTEDSRTLAALRDTLLPKLISGELLVGEAGAERTEYGLVMPAPVKGSPERFQAASRRKIEL